MSGNLRKKTDIYVLHVTGNRPLYDPETTAPEERARLNRDALDAIRRDHIERLGWRDIGYHAITFPDGETLEGRPAGEVGAHVKDFNSVSYGHAIYGGLNAHGEADIRSLTERSIEAAWRWATERIEVLYKSAKLCGHRDLSPDLNGDGVIDRHEWTKLCPLFDVIPEAARRGLPVMRISGEWSRTDPRRPTPPDTRIRYLQRLLTKAGYPIVDDGHEGPKSAAAIQRFQAAMKIPLTGRFDRVTVDRLRAEVENRAGVAVVTQAPIDGLEAAGPNWGAQSLHVVVQALLFLSDLPFGVKVAAASIAVLMAAYLYRDWRRKRDAARSAAAGDAIPAAEPDFFDWLAGYFAAQIAPKGSKP